jgi:beta-glucosidase
MKKTTFITNIILFAVLLLNLSCGMISSQRQSRTTMPTSSRTAVPASSSTTMPIVGTTATSSRRMVYKNPSAPLDERVADLISRMTLEEKVSQMLYNSPAIERLDLPEYNWWNECLHGVARAGRATIFPQAIGLAATFDEDLIYRVSTAISDEARAMHNAAVRKGRRLQYGGLTFWTPNINIFRDPRWGRGQETYGEDPYLTSVIGTAFVRGLQGKNPKYLKAAACAKHYAVHSGPEAGRHSFNAQVSPKDMYETYLPAFKALVDAGVEAIMCAYNRINDEPCCGGENVLNGILREQWGFKGHIVSDCWAISDLQRGHNITDSPVESAALAINSGVNLNCGDTFAYLVEAVKQGLVTEETIDKSLAILLRTRFKLGQFDPPQRNPYSSISPNVIRCRKHVLLAREAAVKSIVMLKNDKNILPLKKDMRFLFVTGPCANDTDMLMGNYHGVSDEMVTILEGITGKLRPGSFIQYRQGFLLDRASASPNTWTARVARDADVVVAVMGITNELEGEEGSALASTTNGDREDIRLPAHQVDWLRQIRESNDKPIVVVLTGGSPLAIPEVHELADAILFVWYPGEQGGNAVADVLFGDEFPTGRLPVTFPKSTDQLPPFDDYSMTGRTYRYMAEEPLYPFGFGLSYTKFEYSNIRLTDASIRRGESIRVRATLKNVGEYYGEEVAQLYLSALESFVETPVCSLKGLQRIRLQPGQQRTVIFTITPEMRSIIDEDGNSVLEPGRFMINIGGCSPGDRGVELGAPKPVQAVFAVE